MQHPLRRLAASTVAGQRNQVAAAALKPVFVDRGKTLDSVSLTDAIKKSFDALHIPLTNCRYVIRDGCSTNLVSPIRQSVKKAALVRASEIVDAIEKDDEMNELLSSSQFVGVIQEMGRNEMAATEILCRGHLLKTRLDHSLRLTAWKSTSNAPTHLKSRASRISAQRTAASARPTPCRRSRGVPWPVAIVRPDLGRFFVMHLMLHTADGDRAHVHNWYVAREWPEVEVVNEGPIHEHLEHPVFPHIEDLKVHNEQLLSEAHQGITGGGTASNLFRTQPPFGEPEATGAGTLPLTQQPDGTWAAEVTAIEAA